MSNPVFANCEMTYSRSLDHFTEYKVLQTLKIEIVFVLKNVCLQVRRILVLWQQQPEWILRADKG